MWLPFEVWCLIFELHLDEFRDKLDEFVLSWSAASNVCRLWRTVIVCSPIFWRHLEIGSSSRPGWMSIALARCSNRSVTLRLHIPSSPNFMIAAHSRAVITSLRPYRTQLECFRVALADPSSFEALRELVASSRFPRLSVLSVRVVVDGTGSARPIPIFRYLEDAVSSNLVTSRSQHGTGVVSERNHL
ncbi:hypothetical protein C8J57DRAFT_1310071 [Mycena rebaudengoi]|nr:hypothetical protein C8J57DRAFT_1310071 [Mycena rebaudengoi]